MRQTDSAADFLRAVLRQVRWRQAHGVIRGDLAAHIEDQAEAYARGGADAAEAEARAVREMGDPADIGLMLDASYRPHTPWRMLLPLGLLALLGAVLRGFVYDMTGAQWTAFACALALGAAGFALLLRLDLYRAVRRAWLLYAAFLLLALLVPCICGRAPYRHSLPLLGYSAAKYLWLLCPVVYGFLLYRLRGTGFPGVLLACALLGGPFLLCVRVFHTTLLCEVLGGLGCLAVLLTAIWENAFGGSRWTALAFVVLGAGFAAFALCIIEPYRLHRVLALWDPARDPDGVGWTILRVREIVRSLRPFGQGGALPPQTALLLQEMQSNTESRNYVLTALMYRYGYAVILLPVGCAAAFLISCVRRIARLQSVLTRMLCIGSVTVLAAQAALSLLACFGSPLWHSAFFPFLSHGSMAFFVDVLLAGVLTSLLRTDTLMADAPCKRRRLTVRLE